MGSSQGWTSGGLEPIGLSLVALRCWWRCRVGFQVWHGRVGTYEPEGWREPFYSIHCCAPHTSLYKMARHGTIENDVCLKSALQGWRDRVGVSGLEFQGWKPGLEGQGWNSRVGSQGWRARVGVGPAKG